jgi:hypothetical protein
MRAIVDTHVQAASSELGTAEPPSSTGSKSPNTLRSSGTANLLPTIYDARVPGCAVLPEESWNKSNSRSGTFRFRPQRDISDSSNEFARP